MKPYKPYAPYSSADYKWIALIGVALIVVIVAGYFVFVGPGEPHIRGAVTSKAKIAALDEEFSDFIGEGHNLPNCTYIKIPASDQLEVGYGPLYATHGYQFIIGKNGTVAAIGYGTFEDKEFNVSPQPSAGSQYYILLLDGCVAPEEWWNRPVFSGMGSDIRVSDNQTLPRAFLLVPWPDWMDFNNPPLVTEIQAPGWYWDGSEYVKIALDTAVQQSYSIIVPKTQISETPPQGGFPFCKNVPLAFRLGVLRVFPKITLL